MNITANTVTVIIAIAAIISPILVALINNHHQAKMKELEFAHYEQLKKLELDATRNKENKDYLHSIFENYLQSTSRCIANPTGENRKIYGENYSISFVYFPPKAHSKLKSINSSIRNHEYDSANDQLEELSIWLSALMKEMLQQ